MFDSFFNHGNIVSVVLMVYAANVMIESLRIDQADISGSYTPLIIRSSIGSILAVGAIPCAIWPAIYVALYSGWVAGIVFWLLAQLFGFAIVLALRVRGPLIGIHFIIASIAYPIGYYLSITNLP
ncbi:hypothetical protein [Maritalea mediterranea]|uniref:Uncharacterized protein n=1 Tax=Maritalea mediterranea TaxID=2909667 RepID=A0ABS9E9V8_9HYPH|nr:hypothetical protein [Maritalea mediterranea]MCF4098193.1 hypothetical protein [Maritalea mediterranea]